jgi:hypothetical protein
MHQNINGVKVYSLGTSFTLTVMLLYQTFDHDSNEPPLPHHIHPPHSDSFTVAEQGYNSIFIRVRN